MFGPYWGSCNRLPAGIIFACSWVRCEWCPRQESNLRHLAPEASALSTELRGRFHAEAIGMQKASHLSSSERFRDCLRRMLFACAKDTR